MFSCIIPVRLHSCITAYALSIPSVGYYWNEKIRLFAEMVGQGKYFCELKELDVNKIIDNIQNYFSSTSVMFDSNEKEKLKIKTKLYLRLFLENVYNGSFKA